MKGSIEIVSIVNPLLSLPSTQRPPPMRCNQARESLTSLEDSSPSMLQMASALADF